MNLAVRTVVTAFVALTFLACAGGVAAAHTALTSSDPGKDAQISTPLTAVVLTFTENINPAFANVVVRSTDNHDWVTGQPQVEGQRLTVDIGPQPLPNGVYTVGYRVVSADGHPVSGSYSFSVVGAPSQSASATTPASSAPSTTAAPPSSASSNGPDTTKSILTAGIAGLAVGGVIAFWQSRKRRRDNAGNTPDGSN